MAESAVKSAADWLGKLLIEEGKYLYGAEEKVEELRDELVWMQCFLRDAESIQYNDEIVALWVRQVKEYVSIAEDIIDKYVIKVMSRRRQTGGLNKLKRCLCFWVEIKARHLAASRIDSLKLKISMLTPRLEKYGLKTAYGMNLHRSKEPLSKQAQQSLNDAHLEGENIVGLSKDTDEIVDALLKQTRTVVAIHGTGGLGKTTLAKNVFHQEKIRNHFRVFAWAYISQQFQVQVVLQGLVTSLTSKSTEMIAHRREQELINEIHQFLQNNKCLVVLDDVWNQEAWDSLSDAFRSDGSSGSRVLLTTRKEQVAKHVDNEALPRPNRLGVDESWELLQKTTGIIQTGNSGSDGDKMVKLGKAMLKHCDGLPLAIVVLGGILRKKETLKEWKNVQKNLTPNMRKGKDHGRSYMEVLSLSYNDLPYHLKPCFLHLGNFPEDYEIPAEKICRMWVAEGLVTWPHDRVSGTESLEDVANDYLSELAQASMVQIMKKGSGGRIKSIRIHDLMRDVCLQKAAAENFLSIVDHRPCPDIPRIYSSLNPNRFLRMAIYLALGVKTFLPADSLTSKAYKCLRSLLFFAGHGIGQDEYQHWMKFICNGLPLLRVLDLEGFCLEGRLTKKVENLIHLRYLSLKGTKVSEVPSSIGNLCFLQVLDLRVRFSGSFVKIPDTLQKLDHLRHLFLPTITYEIMKSKILRLNTLSRLETLKNLEVGKFWPDDLLRLGKLRKLSVKDIVSDEAILKNILESPAIKSGNLQSCSLDVKGNVISLLSSCDCLHRLKVVGEISVLTEPVVFPQYLEVLQLESCKLKDDPMTILGSFCLLKDLSLGRDSFVGKEMICRQRSFPQLTTLNLQWLENLELWKVEEGSMSKLKRLMIMNCGKLKRIPDALPPSLHVICSPCISGIETYGTCICYRPTSLSIADYEEVFTGREEDIERLVHLLVRDKSKKVVLWGAGGVGKATLAKRLYYHRQIGKRFDAAAWARFPHGATSNLPRRILQGLLRDLAPEKSKKDLSQRSSNELSKELGQIMQQKKCLVVLTDLSHSDLTNFDKTFPLPCFEKGSKVLLTVNEEPTMNYRGLVAHEVHPLSEEESWDLFQKRLGRVLNGNDGPIKEEMGKRMLKHCSRHPLSIIMLAGLLSSKETLIEWQTMEEEFNSRAEKDKAFPLIYALSYSDLPLHLPSCFLSLANFPLNTEISTKKLFRMWIATGFVRLTEDEVQADEILEGLAETYLIELVQRGMIQVVKRGLTGSISKCRLHTMLQPLCLAKAKEENFLTIIGQCEPSAAASNAGPITQQMAGHLNQDLYNLLPAPTSSNEHLRSLLFFPNVSNPKQREQTWEWLKNICNHFQRLQVLDLEGMWMTRAMLPEEVGNLSQLRYLSLKGTSVNLLPLSINKLNALQTLDLRVEESIIIPDVLWMLQGLRYLYLPNSVDQNTPRLRLFGLDHLLTLVNLSTSYVQLDNIGSLKKLRKISIKQMEGKDDLELILNSLSTSVDLSVNSDIINREPTILSSLQKLQKVRIKGRISDSVKLDSRMFPACLEELTLKDTKLKDDPVPVLEKLRCLRSLCFDRNSFLGKKMTFAKGFPRLTHLTFRFLSNLEELDMTKSKRMRNLESLVTKDCWRLEKYMEFSAVRIRTGHQGPHGHQLLELMKRRQ